MPVDLTMSVVVSRDTMGLAPLEINDHLDYVFATPELFGGQQAWDRVQVSSPYVDGDFTVTRRKQNVQEDIQVEVFGANNSEVTSNARKLIEAFSQDSFTITLCLNGVYSLYTCEAADYKVIGTGPRWAAKQIQVVLSVPRKPKVTEFTGATSTATPDVTVTVIPVDVFKTPTYHIPSASVTVTAYPGYWTKG